MGSINLDDRDFNSFSLNPSCSSTFSHLHNRTWVVHHVRMETVRCMWAVDQAAAAAKAGAPLQLHEFPDLCHCSTEVTEEEENLDEWSGQPFWYPRDRGL